jgi:uncharacterized protein HemX
MILILAAILIIAVLFIYQSRNIFDQKIKELDKKHQLQTSAINDLDQAQLHYQQLSNNFDHQIKELDKKRQLQTSAINDLDLAQLRYQQLSNKIENELEFWEKRRTILPKVPKNTRKKKLRGKSKKCRK